MSPTFSRLSKIGLLVGYAALSAALVAANRTPAAGYELSIYRSTPTVVWVGLGVGLAVAVLVGLTAPRETRSHDAALLLGGGSALAGVALPILRGYTFFGGGDSLSHVGWAREISAGTLPPDQLLYPGIHTATVLVGEAAGTSLLAANLYVVLVAFPLVFLLCVPLAVQLVGRTHRAYGVGLLAALLFVPVNNVSVHFNAHAASQGILYSAFLFYLALRYVHPGSTRGEPPERVRSWVPSLRGASGVGVLLAGGSVVLLFVHPQQALNLGLCFVAITGTQALFRFLGEPSAVRHRLLHVQTAVVVAAFVLWAPRFERVQGAVLSTLSSILTAGPSAGGVVAQKSTSLTTVGGSLPELFIKLFLVAGVFSLLAGVVLALAPFGRFPDAEANTLVTYLGAALVPVFGVFLVVLASASGDMYFRYQGFIMVPVTVLAATALAYAISDGGEADGGGPGGGLLSGRSGGGLLSGGGSSGRGGAGGGRSDGGDGFGAATVLVVVLLLTLVPIGLAVFHPSPYVYQPNKQVTDAQISGYGASFDYRDPDVQFAGIRGGPERYVDYHYGTERARETLNFPGYKDPIPTSVFAAGNYTDYYEDGRYLTTTRSDRAREVALYDGLRHEESGFRALDATPGVNRVVSSEGFTLRYVTPEEDRAAEGDETERVAPGAPAPRGRA